MVVAPCRPTDGDVIALDRDSIGRPARIGHRGAAALAPENTLRAFRAAVEHGVDLVEFDVLDLPDGPLIVAHSDRLEEVSHGAAKGSVRTHTFEELRSIAPDVPTLDDALRFFVDEAPGVGLHVDLKLTTRVDELAHAVVRHGLERRTVISSHDVPSLRVAASCAPGVRLGFTYPDDRFGLSRRVVLRPLVAMGLGAARLVVPRTLPGRLRGAGATALMLHHRLATRAAVSSVRARGFAVLAWTIADAKELRRVVEAGVDGVIADDPRIFSTLDR